MTLAYSPENEAGGIQLVGQGSLGEGMFTTSMENHKLINDLFRLRTIDCIFFFHFYLSMNVGGYENKLLKFKFEIELNKKRHGFKSNIFHMFRYIQDETR